MEADELKKAVEAAKTKYSEEQRQMYTKLVRKRAHPKGKLTELANMLNATPSLDVVKIIRNELPKVEAKFELIQDQLDDDFESIEDLTGERQLFESRLMNLKLKLEELQSNLMFQPMQQGVPIPTTSQIQLPPAHLPKFDGNRKSWLSWKKLFTSMVGERSDLDESNKFYYLQSACIEGEAIHIVNSTTNSTYSSAMSKLEEKHGNDIQLKQQLVSELYNIESPSPKNAKSLCNFVTRIESCRSFLSTVGIDIEQWSLLLLLHLSTKLDLETRKEVERNKKPNELMKVDQFLNVIKARAQMLEMENEAAFKPKHSSTPIPKDLTSKQNQYPKN